MSPSGMNNSHSCSNLQHFLQFATSFLFIEPKLKIYLMYFTEICDKGDAGQCSYINGFKLTLPDSLRTIKNSGALLFKT